jgi:hypothetical protein
LVHVVGQAACEPSHARGLHEGVPGLLSAAKPQVPVAQLLQAPLHAALQHTPPAQKPLAHSLPLALLHDWPFFFLQVPLPSQTLLPLQAGVEFVSAVPWAMSVVHVPVAFAQDLQVVVQSFSQQRPSTQKPCAHSLPSALVQTWPNFSLQPPVPLHTLGPLQSGAEFVSGAPSAT